MHSWGQVCLILSCAVLLTITLKASGHEMYPNVLAEQLDQYCDWRNERRNGTKTAHTERIGKAGPMGPPGPVGPEGIVNYDRVARMIETGISDQNEKLVVLEEKVRKLEKTLRRMSATSCMSVSPMDVKRTNATGGVYDIYPGGVHRAVEVYCDQETDGGGWIVFQRRMNGSEDFQRNFHEYEAGFGRPDGELWLGLSSLHLLTRNGAELRVDIADWDGNTAYAKYSKFTVRDSSSQYTMEAGGYSGTAGDSLTYHSGQKFYTKDRDNAGTCSRKFKGGMWYNGCHHVNLNGQYKTQGTYTGADGVEWYHWKNHHGYSLKFAEMKIRPV